MVSLPGVPAVAQIDVLDLAGVFVPVVDGGRWHDERATCARALRYLAGELPGIAADYTGCPAYRRGRCDRNGPAADACLFHESERGPGWERARRWCLLDLPGGAAVVTLRSCAAMVAAEIGAVVVGAEVVR